MKCDTQLKMDVDEELKWEPSVNALQIGVEVQDGIVTLEGHVDSYAEQWNAEKAVPRVSASRLLQWNPLSVDAIVRRAHGRCINHRP